MRDQFIIRLTEQAPEQVSWLRLSDSIETPAIEQGSLADAASFSAGAQVIVLVSASDVWLGAANVPTKNKQRLLKAVPYALEEELATDVELLHFSVGKSELEGQVSVAVVDRILMTTWQEMLSDAGVNADILTSELTVIGTEEDAWVLLLDGSRALLRGDKHPGFVADVENFEMIFPLALQENAEQLPANLHVIHDTPSFDVARLVPEDISVTHTQMGGGVLGFIAKEGLALERAVNLLQGDYSRREQLGKLWRPWRYAASLAAVLFVLQLGIAITESSKLEAQSDELKAEVKNIYKKTFPEAKRIVNVKAQMQQRLTALKGKDRTEKANLLMLLADSGAVFKQTSGLVLRSIRYKNGALDVELEVPSLQVLDQLKQNLLQKKGLSVEIQSAASRKNMVQGRLKIRGVV